MPNRWLSRKFLVAVAGLILFLLADIFALDFDTEAVAGILGTIIAYIVGEGIVDKGRAAAEIKMESDYWRNQYDRLGSMYGDLKDRYEDLAYPNRFVGQGTTPVSSFSGYSSVANPVSATIEEPVPSDN